MENKQGNERQKELLQNEELVSGAPGQVLLPKDLKGEKNTKQPSVKREEHSVSSLPEGDNETLGTP